MIVKRLVYIVSLKDFVADVGAAHFQSHVAFLNALLGTLLQFVEGFNPVSRFRTAGTRGGTHPFQFCSVEIVRASNLRIHVVDAFLPFLQIVGIVPLVGVDARVVHLDDAGADAVEEVAVVCHHQDGHRRTAQHIFQPLDHFEVEVIGRLVENEQVGFTCQHSC